MKKKVLITLGVCIALILAAGAGALAASNYGTSDDPLITLSYLSDTFTTQIMNNFGSKLDEKTAAMNTELQTKIDALEDKLDAYTAQGSASFADKTLQSGQQLTCSAGTELILRSGSATAWFDLSDLSGGGTLALGSTLVPNHLYVVSADASQLTVSSDVLILIRGSYTVT